jgi:hypothetical protein
MSDLSLFLLFMITEAREARDEMDRFRIKGCELEVVFAQERRKSPNEMRGRVVNQQNHAGGRGRDRSSSFERHQKQRRRDEGRRNRDDKDDNDSNKAHSDEGGNDKGRQDRVKSSDGKDGED